MIISPTSCSDHCKTRPAFFGCYAGLSVQRVGIKFGLFPTPVIILPSRCKVTAFKKCRGSVAIGFSIVWLDLGRLVAAVNRGLSCVHFLSDVLPSIVNFSPVGSEAKDPFKAIKRTVIYQQSCS